MAEAVNIKDPDAVLDYGFDWSDFLSDGDAVTQATWTIDAGLSEESTVILDGTQTIVWLSGGTAGSSYDCVCHAVMASTREDDRTLRIVCREK